MRRLYIFRNGVLKRSGNTLYLYYEGGKRSIPVTNVSEIYVFSEVEFNKRLLEFLNKNRILLHLFDYYGHYVGTFYPRLFYASGYMTVKQAECYLNPECRLGLAKKFVEGSIRNMIGLLMYYRRKGRDLDDAISILRGRLENLGNIDSIGELLALEGGARKVYYMAWNRIITREGFGFDRRSKRPPENRINALISFGNSLLYRVVLGQIYRTRLDPRIGYLHESNFRSFTLNLDVAEIFKPLFVDRTIFNLVNNRVITPRDFHNDVKGVFMTSEAMKRFVKEFNDRLEATFRSGKRRMKYERLIRIELYKIERHLMRDEEYRPYVLKL